MTKTSTLSRPLLALAAALIAAPLAAEAPLTVTADTVFQQRVSFADLDLRLWSGRQALKVRVQRAANQLCARSEGPFANSSVGFASSPVCADLTYLNARPQIIAAVRRAESGHPFAAAAVVVSLPRAGR